MKTIRRAFALSVAGISCTIGASHLVGQQPVRPATTMPTASGTIHQGPVAVVHGNIPITAEEFGKFLMDRGGNEKLELFVNKRIIEMAAAKQNITVTKDEMNAALDMDIAGMTNVRKEDFLQVILPKYGKTYFEWMEDVIRPRLLLSKLCKSRIKVSEEDLKIQFERRYGEQRECQIIIWHKEKTKELLTTTYGRIRDDAVAFDSEARAQPNPALASSAGKIKPITKHLVAEDKVIEKTAFNLKVGEVSELLSTPQGQMVIKLIRVIPPDVTKVYEKERPMLEAAAYDEILSREIPKYFAELKQAANPQIDNITPKDWQLGRSMIDRIPSVIPSNYTPPANAQTPSGLPPVRN